MDKDRYYVNAELNDDEAYRDAINFARKFCNENGDIAKVILLARTKHNVDWLERIYGHDSLKKLFQGTRIKDCDAIFKIETLATFKKADIKNSLVITLALDTAELTQVDDHYDVRAIVAVPWQIPLLEKWIKSWGATDIRGQKPKETFASPPCVVKAALDELTKNINRSSGLTHPNDNHRAKTYVRALFKAGYELDVNQIHAYLVNELSWDSRHAESLEELIETLKAGKHFQGGDTTGLAKYINTWKESCGE
jgi:hypothetical protein